MLNFHHFSPAISTCVLKCVCFDDGWLLFIVRNVLFSGHHNEGKFSNINSLGSMINTLPARGENGYKYSGANLYFKIKICMHVYLQVIEDNTYCMQHVCHAASETHFCPLLLCGDTVWCTCTVNHLCA